MGAINTTATDLDLPPSAMPQPLTVAHGHFEVGLDDDHVHTAEASRPLLLLSRLLLLLPPLLGLWAPLSLDRYRWTSLREGEIPILGKRHHLLGCTSTTAG